MNIVILLIDALRADHLGCYRYPKKTSPHMDRIAEKSALFENAISQTNWTLPSLYSLMTGRYPSSLQISWWDQKINEKFTVLPQLLAENGYHTGLYTPFKALLNPKSFCSHFHETRQIKTQDHIPAVMKEWVKRHEHSFLLFHIGEYVHEPFFADKKYVSMFLDDDIDAEKISGSNVIDSLTSRTSAFKNIRKLIMKINAGMIRLSKAEIQYLMSAYDAGIFCVDEMVGQIYNVMREQSKDYLFIITADHGQAFMEHNFFGHGLSLYEELIHVPLIADFNGRHSLRVPDPVQLMDLCPTILDLLKLSPKSPLNGDSLMPLLNHHRFPDRGCISESYPYLSLRKADYKLITKHTRLANADEIFNPVEKSWKKKLLTRFLHYLPDKLFNLNEDPGERHNIRRREPAVYGTLVAEINEIAKRFNTEDLRPEEVGIDEEIKKQLIDLGYL